MAKPSCSARRDTRELRASFPPVAPITSTRFDCSCSALRIAGMSPNDSWNAPAAMRCGWTRSRRGQIRAPTHRLVEEAQARGIAAAAARVERVEVDALVEVPGKLAAALPRE